MMLLKRTLQRRMTVGRGFERNVLYFYAHKLIIKRIIGKEPAALQLLEEYEK